MVYIKKFLFPSESIEFDYLNFVEPKVYDYLKPGESYDAISKIHLTCYNSVYPFKILSKNRLSEVEFEPITIFYGGNGSGKTTALNVIAEYFNLPRDAEFNKTVFFGDYLKLCNSVSEKYLPRYSRLLTSDGVFDKILDVRAVNEGLERRRESVFEDYYERRKEGTFQYRDFNDIDMLKQTNKARKMTISEYTRNNMNASLRQYSNGESAFLYFSEAICDNTLFLLDEPENSLSPKFQTELAKVIEEAARFFGCQFIISTHSPFLLSIKGSKIYDFDSSPVEVKKWTELENVKIYRELFLNRAKEFDN